jgi:flagellar motor switch protein FliG
MGMSELRRAAIVLMSLPDDEAAQLLARFNPKQIEMVSLEIARLGTITGDEQYQAIQQFVSANPNALAMESGGLERAKALLERALGKNAAGTIDSMRQQIEAVPFSFLQKVDAQNLITFIAEEHPQTIALVLCHVKPAQAAEIIRHLPPDRQLAVIRRIATMGQTNPEIIAEVEEGLESRMASLMGQSYENAGGVAAVAEILNITDRNIERNLLENLAQEDPELVEEIRRRMFTFEHMVKLSDRDMQQVLKNVETSQWAMALKLAPEELKRKVMGNMSSRAAELLQEEIDFMGPVRRSEVERVQQQIVDVVRRLQDAGEISLHPDSEAEEFV